MTQAWIRAITIRCARRPYFRRAKNASGGGQFTTSGDIPTAAKVGATGAYAVKIPF